MIEGSDECAEGLPCGTTRWANTEGCLDEALRESKKRGVKCIVLELESWREKGLGAVDDWWVWYEGEDQ